MKSAKEAFDHINNSFLIFFSQRRVHRQANAFSIVRLSFGQIAFLPALLPVIRHQVAGDVVEDVDVVFSKLMILTLLFSAGKNYLRIKLFYLFKYKRMLFL